MEVVSVDYETNQIYITMYRMDLYSHYNCYSYTVISGTSHKYVPYVERCRSEKFEGNAYANVENDEK